MRSALDIYRENVLPVPFEILGRRMGTFTLGHAVVMDRLGIDKIEGREELLLAVLLCSMPVAAFEQKLQSRIFALRIVLWSYQCSKRWKKDPESFLRSLKLFGEYLDEQTITPDFDIVMRGEEIEGGVPFVQHLRAVLISKLGYSPATVMQTPFTVAHWDYCSWLEMERAIQVLDGRRGDNEKARFADADAKHEERIRMAMEHEERVRMEMGKRNGHRE